MELLSPNGEHEDKETLVSYASISNEEVILAVRRASSHYRLASVLSIQNSNLHSNGSLSTSNEESISNNKHVSF